MSSEATVRRDQYAALQFRDFRLLTAGRFIAQVGEMSVSVGVSWELYERTHNVLALALVGLVQVIPVMLFSVVGGYIADRYNRKRISLIMQLILVFCSMALLALSITNWSLPALYAILAVIGTARAFNNPAESALVPQMVPPEYYVSAATLSSGIWQIAAVIGPAIGGLLIAIANSAALVYAVNMLSGMVLVSVLLILRSKQKNYNAEGETPFQSVKAGISFVRNSQVIFASITLDMFAVLFGGATALLPVFAEDILHVDAAGLGILRAAPSVGSLLMAAIVVRRPPFQNAGRTLLIAVAGFGVATIVFGLSSSFFLSLAMLFAAGALDYISVVIRHTLVLTQTPDAMRGRVGAVNNIFIGASNELGGFESGVAAALLGPVGAVVVGGIGTLIVVGMVSRLAPQLRRFGALGA